MPAPYVLWRPEPEQRLLPGHLLMNGLQGRTQQGFAELLLEDAMGTKCWMSNIVLC